MKYPGFKTYMLTFDKIRRVEHAESQQMAKKIVEVLKPKKMVVKFRQGVLISLSYEMGFSQKLEKM